jgi:hypothetical protein
MPHLFRPSSRREGAPADKGGGDGREQLIDRLALLGRLMSCMGVFPILANSARPQAVRKGPHPNPGLP